MDGARITVVQSVYYQEQDSEATQRESRFSVQVENPEQPFYRQLTLKPQEKHLINTGWIEDTGVLLLENLEGKFEQQQITNLDSVIHLWIVGDCKLLILPGDCQRLVFENSESLECLSLTNKSENPIKYSLTAYPR